MMLSDIGGEKNIWVEEEEQFFSDELFIVLCPYKGPDVVSKDALKLRT